MTSPNFLTVPPHTPEAQHLFDEDVAEGGYVTNASRLWAHQPAALTGETDAATAAAVLTGSDDGLTGKERAMAGWVRKVVRDPNGTTQHDAEELRDAGFTHSEILGITVFAGLRVALSTVNDALGVRPDAELLGTVPRAVLDAVTFGRPIEDRTGLEDVAAGRGAEADAVRAG